MKRLTAMLLCLLMAMSLAGCGAKPLESLQTLTPTPPTDKPAPTAAQTETPAETAALDADRPYPAESYDAIAALFREKRDASHTDGMDFAVNETVSDAAVLDAPAAAEAPAEAGTGAGGGADYSGTNVQTAGIDEGDIVKTDGKYLYILREREELIIAEAAGADSAVLSYTGLSQWENQSGQKDEQGMNRSPVEMMLFDHTLAVIFNHYSWHSYVDANGRYVYDHEERMEVEFYDVSDPTNPTKTATLGQDGDLITSRLRGSTLYLVSSWYTWDWDEEDPETYIPSLYCEGDVTLLPVDDIFICPGGRNTSYLTVGAYDLESGSCLGVQSLLGAGERVYMSPDRLYVAGSHYAETVSEPRTESAYTVTEYYGSNVTEVHCFTADGGAPVLTASGSIPGYLDSQFSMDEYQGHLRLVTTVNVNHHTVYEDETYGFRNYIWDNEGDQQTNALYILDDGLNVVGSVEDLAEGERVYSARFDGDTAYFCTFRQVDPLFAVDVSDPAAPVVLSALKISGFSEYLHPWSDGLLFGLGREADETTGWAEEMKLVMFDVTDKGDVTVAHTLRCDCSYSDALYDHKAVFISPEKNIIGFLGEGNYYLYSYTPESGFTLLAKLDFNGKGWDARGCYIGDHAYLISNFTMLVVDMADWSVLTTVTLR